MIIRMLFFDTCALLKMFVREDGSDIVRWITSPDTKIVNSLQFFVNDKVCSEFEKKIREFEKNDKISKKRADQILDSFTNDYKKIYFKVLGENSLLAPQKPKTSLDEICIDLKLKSGKNDWDGLHYKSIIDALAFFDGESHPILVTCDRAFSYKVKKKGYRIINPIKQSRDEIQAIFAEPNNA